MVNLYPSTSSPTEAGPSPSHRSPGPQQNSKVTMVQTRCGGGCHIPEAA